MTTTGGLRERKKAQTREALVDTALELFTERGFDRTTIEDIADACDVSPRTFFRYFPTKEDVLFSDSDQRCAQLVAVLAAQPPDRAGLEGLRTAVLAVAAEYQMERTRLLARNRITKSSPSLRTRSAEYQRGWEDSLTKELMRRHPAGTAAPHAFELRLRAATAIAALRVAIDHWLEHPRGPGLQELLDHAFRRLAGGFDAG